MANSIKVTTICTPDWSPTESYARIAMHLADYFQQDGYVVNELGEHGRNRRYIPAMGGIFLGYPTHFKGNYSPLAYAGKKIAITMFESTALPEGWVEALNMMDYTVVPSEFCKSVFIDEGVHPDKVIMAPLGISPAFRESSYTRTKEKPYQYLAFLDRGRRKGWDTALSAFQMMAKENPDCHLTLKSKEGALPYIVTSGVPNVTIVEEDFDDYELAEFYSRFHVLINPNTGEGFGFIPREFAATGGIALSTNFGGTADEVENWGIPLDYDLVPAWAFHPEHPSLGMWAQPDMFDTVAKLKHVQSNMDQYMKKAANWSAFVKENYSWTPFCKTVKDLWES